MTLELSDQEHQYILQVMLQQPVRESLPIVLKLTNQKLVPASEPPPPVRLAGS